MGDLVAWVYDMYEDYKVLCKKIDKEPIDILDDWFTDFTILKDKNDAENF